MNIEAHINSVNLNDGTEFPYLGPTMKAIRETRAVTKQISKKHATTKKRCQTILTRQLYTKKSELQRLKHPVRMLEFEKNDLEQKFRTANQTSQYRNLTYTHKFNDCCYAYDSQATIKQTSRCRLTPQLEQFICLNG